MTEKRGDECWVYVFARRGVNGLTSPVKIGITKNIDARISTVQTSCPFEIEMAYYFECADRDLASQIEKSFHVTQSKHNEHGEWFSLDPIIAIHLLCIAYRTLLSSVFRDEVLVNRILDYAGVFWAEKRFKLNTSCQALQ